MSVSVGVWVWACAGVCKLQGLPLVLHLFLSDLLSRLQNVVLSPNKQNHISLFLLTFAKSSGCLAMEPELLGTGSYSESFCCSGRSPWRWHSTEMEGEAGTANCGKAQGPGDGTQVVVAL